MEKIDHFLSFLSYSRRLARQLTDLRNLKYFYLIFKGFTPDKGYYYDFKKYGYKNYITDSKRYLKTVFLDYNNRDLLNDKYACTLFLKEFCNNIVPVYALIDHGEFHLLNHWPNEEELFSGNKKFVLKPRHGREGRGIMILESRDNQFYLNGTYMPDFKAIFKGLKSYVMVPYLEQHEYASSIYPHTLNTIRLLTCIQNKAARVIAAAHRFGIEGSGCVDNISAGGLSTYIDIENGVMGETHVWINNIPRKDTLTEHPNTQQKIAGVQIPNWDLMTKEMIRLHQSIKFVKYVGWDIAITHSDFKIIEANYASDLDFLQLKAPLLVDNRNRKFFTEYA